VKRLRGPELRLGKPEVPAFLVNLYYDLRDRRLLPLVALVLVAIVAVPFLLGGSSEEAPEPSPSTGPIEALKEAASDSSKLTVVEATPGLRDYRKRLRARTPTDPFKQRYTAPVLKNAKLNEAKSTSTTAASGGETTSTSTTTVEAGPPAAGPPGGSSGSPPSNGGQSGGDGGPSGKGGLVFYTFAVDVRISHTETKQDGSEEMGEPRTHERVLPATSLPGDKAQVVTYMGIAPISHKPLFLVSTDVSAVFGDARCIAGSDSCQLLELEPGLPETFVYGPDDVRYKITVLKVEPVATGRS
jgi:hypothetical protein